MIQEKDSSTVRHPIVLEKLNIYLSKCTLFILLRNKGKGSMSRIDTFTVSALYISGAGTSDMRPTLLK